MPSTYRVLCACAYFNRLLVSRDFWGDTTRSGPLWCCVHMALGHTLACISCHGGMGSPLVHIGDDVKRTQIYQKTLSSISDDMWMSMVDFGLRLIFYVLESVCHALYMLSSIFVHVFGLGLFSCFCAMPVWCHINININININQYQYLFVICACRRYV